MLEGVKKAHFIGIGGVGMSATAKLLKDLGIQVCGSDEEVYPPISTFLEREELSYKTPYAASNIPADADIIVVGKNAKLVPETNEEVQSAFQSGKPIFSFPQILSELAKQKEVVIVAGAYGKSSTTALLAHCLAEAEKDPSFFIGALPYTPKTSARLGTGTLFVLEGDEYPSSNTDPRSKFLHFSPSHLLITPLAHDHFNIFPTPESYLKPFAELVALLPDDGTLVISTGGALSKKFIAPLMRSATTYGVREGDYHAADIVWGEKTSFTIVHNETAVAQVETSQLGEHSIENILGVAAFLFSRSLVTKEQFAKAIGSFRGIHRRLDKKSEKTSIPIYEGFGSSYEKARSAIAAIKLHFPSRRLIIIFEPHTFSWRNRSSISWYDTAFQGAEKIFIYEPASQGAGTHAQLTQSEILERVRKAGFSAEAISEPEEALSTIQNDMEKDDVILFLTSGNLGGLMEPIIARAEQKFPK